MKQRDGTRFVLRRGEDTTGRKFKSQRQNVRHNNVNANPEEQQHHSTIDDTHDKTCPSVARVQLKQTHLLREPRTALRYGDIYSHLRHDVGKGEGGREGERVGVVIM